MKRLFYPPPIRELILVLSLLLVGNHLLLGEGSKDFWDYEGFRLFYLIAPSNDGIITNEQQLKVYAGAGEFLNLGSSHVGIRGGFIQVYRPNGTLHTTFDGVDGTSIINNDIEELAGPTGGGATNGAGYTPGVIQVQAGEEGVWTVVLDYPAASYSSTGFNNLLNGESWTRADNQPQNGRVALAWDITVSQSGAGNQGGTLLEGRVYSNEYISIVSNNENSTSPTFFVLTRSGFLYQIDFMQADPWGFPIFSNSKGIVTGNQTATYESLGRSEYERSADIAAWSADQNYLYHPQAEDSGLLWNNKIFFNEPDTNMPNTATVTDIINGNNTHTTWLYTEVATQNIGENPFGFTGDVPANSICDANLTMQQGKGGNFVYASQVAGVGQLRLDLNNNGSFDDPVDRIIESEAILGEGNAIFWDGKDGLGVDVPATPSFPFNYDLRIRGGEVHILMDDVEKNLGGIAFTRLNGVNSPSSEYYYDHSKIPVLGAVSGGGSAGNALATTDLYTYDDSNNDGIGDGNEQLLDFWTFIEASNFGSGNIAIAVVEDCPPATDNDNDGIPDEEDLDDDNDGITDVAELAASAGANGDTDGDGIPNVFDLDSDNDGITDLFEAGHGQADANGDGIIDGPNADFGANGFYNPLSTDPNAATAVMNYTPADPDGDGVPDHVDLDSDNDGLLDVVEAGYGNADSNRDGRIDDGNGNPSVDATTGLPTLIGTTAIPLPPDSDGDGVRDWHDLDSDNDGIHGTIENLNIDLDNDGRIGTGQTQVDANGIPIANADGSGITLNPTIVNTDGTGNPDYLDLDSDADGLLDIAEARLPDGDGDGILGVGTPTVNINGVPSTIDSNGNTITSISNPIDSDSDGMPDFQDLAFVCDGTTTPVLSSTTSGGGTFCAGASTVVSVSGTTGFSGPVNFTWTGPNGFTQSGRLDNANSVYSINLNNLTTNESGTYSLVVTTDEGCVSAPANIALSVGDGPNAAIQSTNAGDMCSGETVSFSVSPTGAGITYEWFRNGVSIATTTDPSFIVDMIASDDSGDYTVVASQNGCPGASSAVINLNVSSSGQIRSEVIIDNSTLCEGQNFEINANPIAGATEYIWFLEGAPFARGAEPFIIVRNVNIQNTGSYSVQVVVDGCNTVESSSVNVTVFPSITASLGVDRSNVCSGESFTLNAVSSGTDITYDWYRDGNLVNTTTENSLTINSAAGVNAGVYTVVPRQTICEGPPSNGITVAVTETPSGGNITAANTSLCPGESISLTSTDYGVGTTYNWYLNGTLISSTSEPSYAVGAGPTSAGTYTMIPSRNGCEGVASNAIAISVGDNVAIPSISADKSSLCPGDPLTLTASGVGGTPNYEWFFNGTSLGATSDATFPVPNPAPGSYTVAVTGAQCGGGTSSAVVITETMMTEMPTITADRSSLCPGDPLTLNVSGVSGTPNYEWFQNGVSIGATSDPFFPVQNPTAGVYTVAITGAACGGGTSEGITITDTPVPSTGAIVASNTMLCPGESVNITTTDLGTGVSYNWYRDGQLISTTATPSFSDGAIAGSYTMVPSIGACQGASSNAIAITVTDMVETPTITADRSSLCPGDALTLSVSGVGGTPNYEWFQNGVSIGATSDPFFPVQNPIAGTYSVAVSNAQCGGGTSNDLVIIAGATPDAGVIATQNADLCAGDNITLTSNDLGAGVNYNWYLDGTLVSTTDMPTYTGAASEGSYTMIAALGGCEGAASNAIPVLVGQATAAPSITADNQNLCPGDALVLTAGAVSGATTYEWFKDGISIGSTDAPTLSTNPTDSGNYTVMATGACGGGTSDALVVIVESTPDESAMIMDIPSVACGVSMVNLEANAPAFGTGMWSSSDPNVLFADATNPSTTVSGLGSASTVVWTLSNDCGVYATDQTTITVASGEASAVDDEFTVDFNGSLANGNIMGNDLIDGTSTITVISNPANGTASITGGMIQYTPNTNYFGTDRLEYEICNTTCPNMVCDRAFVNLNVVDNPDCFIPDVITPNNDGFNDTFRVPCAGSNDIGLKIFNRWGDKVYETDRYTNDWAGTHDGNPLPPGPYYYILTEPNANGEKRTGCIAVSR